MIIFSTANVVADTVFWNLMNSNIVEYDFLGIIVYVCASLDMFCLLACPRLMTNLWLPKRLRQYAKLGTVTQESSAVNESKGRIMPGSGSPVTQPIVATPGNQIKSLESGI